jgi:hypothetical protein
MIKIKKMNKTKVKIKIKIRAMIKRELCKKMREMIKRSQDHHHHLTQEFDKLCNVITPSTTYLVISRRGSLLNLMLQTFVKITRLSLL